MSDFLKRVDTIFMGRKSYELTLKLGGTGFPDLTSYVFSNSLSRVEEGYRLFEGDLKKEVQEFRNTPGRDIWLFGGAALISSFMIHNLVDEILLAVHPVFLGSGMPAFGDFTGSVNLTLLDSKSYSTGLIMLHYSLRAD